LLCLCLLCSLAPGFFAQQPAPKGPPPPRSTPAEPPPMTESNPKAKVKDIPPELLYDTSDGKTSVRLIYWHTRAQPDMFTGKEAPSNVDSTTTFPSKYKPAPGAELSLPAGKNHTIRLSYFRTQGSGNTVAGTPPTGKGIVIWGATFNPGDKLSNTFTMQNAKISLDYLSWPFPLNNRRFRVKTLWEAQYISIRSGVSAPLAPVQDSAGNALQTSGTGSNWFIFPSLGMGVEIMASKHFRFEAKGSGFGIPHRSNLWDADAFFAYKSGQFEIDFGGKAFHFRTSAKREEYLRATMPGAYIGIRWYPK
jgi:hypothetical protein